MFSIEEALVSGFDKLILRANDGGYAEIVPGCGGALHAFGVENNGDKLNVIDHYASGTEFLKNVESLGHKSCKLSPYVCRMKNGSYVFADKRYTIETGYGEHALHGLIYRKAFTVLSKSISETHAALSIQYQYREDDPGFPFSYDLVVTYTLLNEHRLQINTSVINHSNGLMPVQDGWHPYFCLGGSIDDCELEFQSVCQVEFDKDLIPTGKKIKDESFGSIKIIGDLKLDNCYELDLQECQPLCVFRNPARNVEVQIYPGDGYPYLQLYTPEHRKSIAIENISGPPNGFNLDWGHRTLERGENAAFETTYKIHFLK